MSGLEILEERRTQPTFNAAFGPRIPIPIVLGTVPIEASRVSVKRLRREDEFEAIGCVGVVDNRKRRVFDPIRVRFRINSPKVIHQVFDAEVVVVNLESGNYYSVGGSGIEIWRQLEADPCTDAILAAFGGNGEAGSSITRFLDELAREELIVPTDSPPAMQEAALDLGKIPAFVPPTLEKFDDMRDLLLLDPIHELDESGWPVNRPPVQT